jgi:hypothetical protein
MRLVNERLEEAGDVPLPSSLTPHKLRDTFASLLVALGVDSGEVMDRLGHAYPGPRCGCTGTGCAAIRPHGTPYASRWAPLIGRQFGQ